MSDELCDPMPYGQGPTRDAVQTPPALVTSIQFRWGIQTQSASDTRGPQVCGVVTDRLEAERKARGAAVSHQNALRELGIDVQVTGWIQRQRRQITVTWSEPTLLEASQ